MKVFAASLLPCLITATPLPSEDSQVWLNLMASAPEADTPQVWMNLMTTAPGGDFAMNFGFFDQFLGDDDEDEEPEHFETNMMGLLNPRNPTSFPDSHIMKAIFEPIKDDVKPVEPTTGQDSHYFS